MQRNKTEVLVLTSTAINYTNIYYPRIIVLTNLDRFLVEFNKRAPSISETFMHSHEEVFG